MKPVKSLEFDAAALEDLEWWIKQDRNKALRIINLIRELQRDPFRGIGKPEPLIPGTVGATSLRVTINLLSRHSSSGLSRFNPYTDLR